jgi:hypothetical protein
MSAKCARFTVQSSASRRRAQAAIAMSASRSRGFLRDRYKLALSAASSASKGKAASDGNRASCASNSSATRGPRNHSYNTIVHMDSLSPCASIRLNAGNIGRSLVRLSMRTEVSRKITNVTVHPAASLAGVIPESPSVRAPCPRRFPPSEEVRIPARPSASSPAQHRSTGRSWRDTPRSPREPLRSSAWTNAERSRSGAPRSCRRE